MASRAQRPGQHSKCSHSDCSHSKCSHSSRAMGSRAMGSRVTASRAVVSSAPWEAWPPPPSSRSWSSGPRLRGRARQGAPAVEAGVGRVGRGWAGWAGCGRCGGCRGCGGCGGCGGLTILRILLLRKLLGSPGLLRRSRGGGRGGGPLLSGRRRRGDRRRRGRFDGRRFRCCLLPRLQQLLGLLDLVRSWLPTQFLGQRRYQFLAHRKEALLRASRGSR